MSPLVSRLAVGLLLAAGQFTTAYDLDPDSPGMRLLILPVVELMQPLIWDL